MIDNITLTFSPKSREDFLLYESISSLYNYRRNVIIESLSLNIKLFIFPDKRFLQFKIFHLAEYLYLNEVTNRDYLSFEQQFNKDISELNISLNVLRLTRIDFKIDLKVSDIEMQEYLFAFSKLRQQYYSLHKRVYFTDDKSGVESVYYKGSKFNINIYDKQIQLNKKGINDPFFEGILRIELQLKTKELSDYCKATGASKELINFWHTSVRDDFFEKILIEKFLYVGDYFSIQNVKKQIKEIKTNTKQKIIKFCRKIAKEGITEAINTLSRNTATMRLSIRN